MAQPLDYENQKAHNFTILAIDGGLPPLTGTVAVTAYVDDVNDNAPVVTSGLLLTALENHSAGKIIMIYNKIEHDMQHFYIEILQLFKKLNQNC